MVILCYLFIFSLGLVVGSFLTAFTYRNPRGYSINKGRSFCDKCKKPIHWYDNIPLLSYIILRSKCRNCGKKISLRYPLIEMFTALAFLSVYYFYQNCSFLAWGEFNSQSSFCTLKDFLGWWLVPVGFLIVSILIIVFVIDYEKQIIIDSFVFILFLIALIILLITSNNSFYLVLLSSFISSFFFLILHLITKGKGMGGGDVKLVLALSMFLSWQYIVLYIFLSFSIGAIVGLFLIAIHKASFGRHIPFAPFIIVSFLMTFLFGDKLAQILIPFIL